MVHYIRYLRTPQVRDVSRKVIELSAVVAVTTDLGDSFYSQDITLVVRVIDATKNGEILCSSHIPWKAGFRAAKFNLECNLKYSGRLISLHVTTRDTISALVSNKPPAIVDIWSTSFPLKPKSKAEPLVERRLQLNSRLPARIWEETGDSIARHIWDASLGCLLYLNSCFDDSKIDLLPSLRRLLTTEKSKKLRVLEVGAGCGIVGIALSQMKKSDVLLTDLEDAQDILQTNIDCATPALGSSLSRQVLEWGTSLDELNNAKFDLILVSDCIYNPDSSILLVETLQNLANRAPNLLIFVAFKRRHDADNVFFEKMHQSGLQLVEQNTLELPHLMSEIDAQHPTVEIFAYSRKDDTS